MYDAFDFPDGWKGNSLYRGDWVWGLSQQADAMTSELDTAIPCVTISRDHDHRIDKNNSGNQG